MFRSLLLAEFDPSEGADSSYYRAHRLSGVVADLYKAEFSIPIAFQAVSEGTEELEGRVRRRCCDEFRSARLLERILPDIERAMAAGEAVPA